MAFFNEAWFIHAVDDNVTQLAQQKASKISGSCRTKTGVVGKTFPFQRIGSIEMQQVAARDQDTQYANPPQSKRRAQLSDFALAVLVDTFDEIKMLADPQSEFAQILAFARNRKLDSIVLQAALGSAVVVDEANESTSLSTFPAGQQIANGGTGLTMAKIRSAKLLFDNSDVDDEDRYFFYSPDGMRQLLSDNTVTSSDYSTINALTYGGFPTDASWMSFKWRRTTRLAKTGNIRSCIAWAKSGHGLAVGMMNAIEIDKAVHKNNAMQVLIKLSAGSVRIDDACVAQIDIDESL